MSTGSYFAVTGPRKVFDDDGKPTGEVLDARLRFEALRVSDAEDFATAVYRREKIVCDIHELRRGNSVADVR